MLIYKPYKFLIYGLIVYFAILFLGPYNFTLYNINGALYLTFAFILLIISAWIADRPYRYKYNNVTPLNKYDVVISRNAETFLIFVIITSYIAFIIHFSFVRLLPTSGGYLFAGGDLRAALSEGRPLLDKIAEVMLNMGIVAYLIISRLKKTNYNYTKIMSLISFFLPAVAALSVGARSRVITTIGLFLIINGMNKKEGIPRIEFLTIRKSRYKWLIIISIGILLYFTFSLFELRGVMDAKNQYLIYYGDTTLKPIYLSLYEATNGVLGPLYKGSLYYTHSMPVFTWAFDQYNDIPVHWGALLLYLEGYFLRLFNIPFPDYISIVRQSPVAGLYSTFLIGYFLDWGKIGSLFMISLTGILFGRISYKSKNNQMAYFILPVTLFMCWVAPIYYFWHMGWETVLIWFIIIYPICRLLGLRRTCEK